MTPKKEIITGLISTGDVQLIQDLDRILPAAQAYGTAWVTLGLSGKAVITPADYRPTTEEIQQVVGGLFTPVTFDPSRLDPALTSEAHERGPYLAYACDDLPEGSEFNALAHQLLGVPVYGPVMLLVGFSINDEGVTVPTPVGGSMMPWQQLVTRTDTPNQREFTFIFSIPFSTLVQLKGTEELNECLDDSLSRSGFPYVASNIRYDLLGSNDDVLTVKATFEAEES